MGGIRSAIPLTTDIPCFAFTLALNGSCCGVGAEMDLIGAQAGAITWVEHPNVFLRHIEKVTDNDGKNVLSKTESRHSISVSWIKLRMGEGVMSVHETRPLHSAHFPQIQARVSDR